MSVKNNNSLVILLVTNKPDDGGGVQPQENSVILATQINSFYLISTLWGVFEWFTIRMFNDEIRMMYRDRGH